MRNTRSAPVPQVPLFTPDRLAAKAFFDHNKENVGQGKNGKMGDVGKNVGKDGKHTITAFADKALANRWPRAYVRYSFPIIDRKDFGKLSLLKPGGLGVVYRTMHHRTKQEMVLKLLLDPDDWNAELRGYHNSNDNPAIVKVIALMTIPAKEINVLCQGIKGYLLRQDDEKVPVMLFEMWNGSLREAIDTGAMREWGLSTAVGLMKDVSRAVSYMHKNGIMHRDIKPDNILYRKIEGKISAGLCDLGLATKVHTKDGQDRGAFTQGVGTNKYMAPECASGTDYCVSADVYSLAVTAWEVCIAACRLRTQLPDHLKRLVKKGSAVEQTSRLNSRKFYLLLKHIYQNLQSQQAQPLRTLGVFAVKPSSKYHDAYDTSDTQSEVGDLSDIITPVKDAAQAVVQEEEEEVDEGDEEYEGDEGESEEEEEEEEEEVKEVVRVQKEKSRKKSRKKRRRSGINPCASENRGEGRYTLRSEPEKKRRVNVSRDFEVCNL